MASKADVCTQPASEAPTWLMCAHNREGPGSVWRKHFAVVRIESTVRPFHQHEHGRISILRTQPADRHLEGGPLGSGRRDVTSLRSA